jgi:diacylglycerol kinase family enzyme
MTSPQVAPIPCLINLSAGNGRAVLKAVERDARFAARKCKPDELLAGIQDAVESRAPRIAVAGGDGTIATAAGVLVRSGVELALLPAGTRDHFARTLKIPIDIEDALDIAAGGRIRRVDVGFVNDRMFLNTSSVGAYVEFVHRRERHRKRIGYHLASLVAAAGILAMPDASAVDVAFDGEHRRYRTPLVFLRLRQREAGMHEIGTDDGKAHRRDEELNNPPGLRLGIVRGRTRIRLAALALTTALHGLDAASQTPHLKSFFIDECVIEVSAAQTFVAVDGETIPMSTPLSYRVLRGALRIVIPDPDAAVERKAIIGRR